ncbi:proline-rich membrane anchor 1-like isoform X2 [Cyprinus carpio]|uniref:Proline-rich membrane anchor 1-like isoform X2 n=1 Tax=Cyprinus carpio TaxID=7962 RepID=A0A9Q9XIY3_CYPCA|nr:proline-rich membrane anchor 1-like isoform X2 [Cyprinus carpio]
MFIRNLLPLSLGFLPFLLSQCFLSLFLPLFQFARGELQKSCSRTTVAPLEGSCQLPCQCRPYPPLPPPPPPPPPPRLLAPTVAPSTVSPITPWRREMEILVLGTVSCASVIFLLLTAIICYKAIKRATFKKRARTEVSQM